MTSASIDLPGDTSSGGAARAFVSARLAGWDVADPQGDVLILVSELVNNAVLHGGGPVSLTVKVIDGRVRLEVQDVDKRPPAPRQPDARGGFGLNIVARLCVSWGVDSHDEGKVVWCEYLLMPA